MKRRIHAACVLLLITAGCSRSAPEHEVVDARGDAVSLSHSTVADGRVHFYTFKHEGKNVNFLFRTDGKGKLHAHLDACYACYQYKRGYVVDGSNLVCIACRLEYALEDEVWDYIGACAPIPIRYSLKNGQVVIARRALLRASRFF